MSTEIIPTRESLLVRLKDWDDQKSWRDFFELYWRLIYGVAIKSGLTEVEAQEVLQETVITFAKEIKTFEYDRSKGRFKSWLLQITRRRIADEFRKRKPHDAQLHPLPEDSHDTSMIDRVPDPAASSLDEVWEEEWRANLLEVARERLKHRISQKHFEIFEQYVIQHKPVREVAKQSGVSVAQVYWVKHTISGEFRKEILKLEDKPL